MYRRFLLPLALVAAPCLAAALCLAGCSAAPQASKSGAAAVQPVSGGLDPELFHHIWINLLPLEPGDSVNHLYLRKDTLFAITPRNAVFAIDLRTGSLKYLRYVNGGGREVGAPVILTDSIVFPGQSNLEVYTPSGDFVKSFPLDFTISSNPVGAANELFMGIDVSGGELADVDTTLNFPPPTQFPPPPAPSPVIWRLMTFGEVRGRPAYYKGVVFVGSGDGALRAVNADRTPAWTLERDSYDTGGQILGDIGIDATGKDDDIGVYAASDSGRLVCVNRADGRLKWQYLAPYPLTTGPVVTATSVYQFVPNDGLAALSKSDLMDLDPDGKRKVQTVNRTPRWVCHEAVQLVSEDGDLTYVATADGELLALDSQTGQIRFRSGITFSIYATNVTDSTIYAVTADGTAYALKPALAPGSPGYIE